MLPSAKCAPGPSLAPSAPSKVFCAVAGSAWLQRPNAVSLLRYVAATAASGSTLTRSLLGSPSGPSQPLLKAYDEPSSDLKEMCTLQLELLHNLLSNVGETYEEMRVYARLPSSLGSRTAQLKRVACVRGFEGPLPEGRSPALIMDSSDDDIVVLSMGDGWLDSNQVGMPLSPGDLQLSMPGYPPARQSSGSEQLPSSFSSQDLGSGSGSMPGVPKVANSSSSSGDGWQQPLVSELQSEWEVLVQQEVLVLPQSGTLVVPLMEAGLMVGLLVMDPKASPSIQDVGMPPQDDVCKGPSLDSVCLYSWDSQEAMRDYATATSSDSSDGTGSNSTAPPRPHVSPKGAALESLRLAVPVLAKACALDLKWVLQSAQLSAQAEAARGLLRDVQRGASALNTFSAMLLPRMPEGQPDQDLAQGISMQGKRLQDLIRQLDTALARPPTNQRGSSLQTPAAAAAVAAAAAAGPLRGGAGLPPGRQAPPTSAAAAAAAAAVGAAAVPRPLPGTSSKQQQQAGVAAGISAAAAAAATVALGTATAAAAAAAPALPGSGSSGRSSSSSSGGAGEELALDERGSQAGDRTSEACSSSRDEDGHVLRHRRRAAAPPPASLDNATVIYSPQPATYEMRLGEHDVYDIIDVEKSEGSCTSTSLVPVAAPVPGSLDVTAHGGSSSSSSRVPRAGSGSSSSRTHCDVADAMKGLLNAAFRLAALSNIHVNLQPPLSVEPPQVSNAKTPGDGRRAAQATGAAAGAAAAGRKVLLPVRPMAPPGPSALGQQQQQGLKVPVTQQQQQLGWKVPVPLQQQQQQQEGLRPRPMRPLRAAVPAAALRRIMSYILDIALQCTPQGGQLCVSAQLHDTRQAAASAGSSSSSQAAEPVVQLVVMHTGCLVLDRVHATTKQLLPVKAVGSSFNAASSLPVAAKGQLNSVQAGSKTRTHSRSTTPGSGSAAKRSQPSAPGSGLLSFSMAEELVLAVGGSVTVTHPVPLPNSVSGLVDTATCIEILLPARVD